MPSTPTPPAPAPAELPKGTPSWLSHLVALVLVGVAAGLDAWQPNHTLSTPTVQGVVLVAAFAVASLLAGLALVTLVAKTLLEWRFDLHHAGAKQ